MDLYKLLIYYIVTFITSIVYLKCFSKITNKEIKYNFKKKIIIGLICFLMLINNNFILSSLRLVISFFITILLFKIFFNLSWKETTTYTIIFTIVCSIIDLILSVFIFFSIQNIKMFNDNIYFKSIFSIVELFIIYNITKLTLIRRIIIKIQKCINKFINFYSFSLLLILIINIMFYFRGKSLGNISYLLTGLLCVAFIIITLNVIINDKYNNSILNEKNNNLKDSFKAYAETIDECRELKHNLKNDLLSLSTTIPKKYQTAINILINKYNKGYEWINRIDEIPEGLQGLIYLKCNEAKSKKIYINLNISENIKPDKRDYIDLMEIMSILIDNAIDASYNSKYKIIEINIFQKSNYLIIRIINNYKNNIDVNKIGNKNYSTKEIKSGLGLNYIQNLKNSKIKVEFKIINNLFITQINYSQKN